MASPHSRRSKSGPAGQATAKSDHNAACPAHRTFRPLAIRHLMLLSTNDRPTASKRFFFCATGSALTGHRRAILQYQCLNGPLESLIKIKSVEHSGAAFAVRLGRSSSHYRIVYLIAPHSRAGCPDSVEHPLGGLIPAA
jgi:hypothetical protein